MRRNPPRTPPAPHGAFEWLRGPLLGSHVCRRGGGSGHPPLEPPPASGDVRVAGSIECHTLYAVVHVRPPLGGEPRRPPPKGARHPSACESLVRRPLDGAPRRLPPEGARHQSQSKYRRVCDQKFHQYFVESFTSICREYFIDISESVFSNGSLIGSDKYS